MRKKKRDLETLEHEPVDAICEIDETIVTLPKNAA
jgi:hypothetical protein